jgi:hypothetical protein
MEPLLGLRSPATPSPISSPLCGEVLVLFVLCMLDLLSSAWLFHRGLATESNPLLRGAAEAGVIPFALAKLASFLPALAAAEWLRRRRPRFVQRLLRGVIAGYLLIYALGIASQFRP